MSAHKTNLVTRANARFERSMPECAIRNGDTVVIAVRRPETMTKLQTECTEDRLLVVKVDVSKPDEGNAAFDTVKKAFGRTDVVYNNAGYAIVGEVSFRALLAVTDHIYVFRQTNFWGLVYVTRTAVAFFREVNQDGSCKFPPSVNALTDALSKELGPTWGIKPALIEAGYYKTDALKLKTFEVYEYPSYTNPAAEGVAIRQAFANFDPNNTPFVRSDPGKVTDMEDPPLWLPLEKDAYVRARGKIASYLVDIDKYESLSEDLAL
ncbi:hypothetical protein DFS33DRAFT_1371252 [Desarmillaria ectypa]|nr:hypothetical protein DFS33DRAFT_1371252 [Desarmillaria ectypa]